MAKKAAMVSMSPGKMLKRIQRACVILGLKPPKKLFRKTKIVIQRQYDPEHGHGWRAHWSGPKQGQSDFISAAGASESDPAASPEC